MPDLIGRYALERDRRAIHHLAVANDMFSVDELDGIDEMFDGYLAGALPDHRWLVVEDASAVLAAAYYAPEPFADRLWNLYFLADGSRVPQPRTRATTHRCSRGLPLGSRAG